MAMDPQETENRGKILAFWQQFETEIISAKEEGCLVLIEMDANAKLGANIIYNDPNCISENGLLLRDIIERQNLICLNRHEKCSGSITRHRKTIHGDEKSIIDFIIVCDQLATFLHKMIIDEKRANVLTKYVTLKGVRVKSESDHNPLFAEFSLTFSRKQSVTRCEMFDFKNTESLAKYKELTNDSEKLRNCFDGNVPPKTAFDRFFKQLNNTFHRTFKKIRIRSKTVNAVGGNQIDKKMQEKTELEKVMISSNCEKETKAAKNKLDQVEIEIYEILSEKNAKIVSDQVACLDTLDGSFNQIGMWKVKNKLCPKPRDPPTAKKDEKGNLITAPAALKKLYLQTYKTRLEHRKISERYQDLRDLKNELWDIRFQYLKEKPTTPWIIVDLEKATKTLKNNQARDPNGMISELFKPNNAGKDLKKAVLDLMNLVLSSFQIPEFMQLADISSIFKNKKK